VGTQRYLIPFLTFSSPFPPCKTPCFSVVFLRCRRK